MFGEFKKVSSEWSGNSLSPSRSQSVTHMTPFSNRIVLTRITHQTLVGMMSMSSCPRMLSSACVHGATILITYKHFTKSHCQTVRSVCFFIDKSEWKKIKLEVLSEGRGFMYLLKDWSKSTNRFPARQKKARDYLRMGYRVCCKYLIIKAKRTRWQASRYLKKRKSHPTIHNYVFLRWRQTLTHEDKLKVKGSVFWQLWTQ